jgi:Golgi SNAP receptor complex protein 2
MVDELHEMGTKALQSLGTQRNTLKNAHRKALDVANILGMSSSLLKIIERTDKVNAYVVYGCMVFTVLVVVLIWWYIR